ncbi:hypothetical protein EDD86DRAFT_244544 [Gorgonomyces haynaldii]|nr:hypothetical protein EDD86DRAFT_244544 [Gorgonomyces haynaldii]
MDEKRMNPHHAAAAAFFTDRSQYNPRPSWPMSQRSPGKEVYMNEDYGEFRRFSSKSLSFDHSPLKQTAEPLVVDTEEPTKKLQAFDYDKLVAYLDRPAPKRPISQSHSCVCPDTRLLLESGPFWLNFCEPTEQEMEAISAAFGIHPLTNEDIQTPDTREKCEVFPNYYFVVIRSFDQDSFSATYLQPVPVFICIFRECVISFQFSRNAHPRNVLLRVDQLLTYGLHVTTDWINYALIDDITDGFIPILKRIELEVDAIDDLVLIIKQTEQYDMMQRIGKTRKQVNMLLRLMTTKADLIRSVISRCIDQMAPEGETRLYLEDIVDHVITLHTNLMHYETTLSRAHSNYLAQISIELTQASNRTSDIVLKMTVLASILVPLNVITGLWGMNVPGQDEPGLYWFAIIVCGMVLISLINWLLLRQSKVL